MAAIVWITLPTRGVRVTEFGEGPPLLVVPGHTGEVFMLTSLLARGKGRRILAINCPGAGLGDSMDDAHVDLRSFALETLVAVLDAYGLERVPVLAHSLGAHWSLWLATDRPERISALVTLGNPRNVMIGKAPRMARLFGLAPACWLFGRLRMPSRPDVSFRALRVMGHDAELCSALPRELAECVFRFRRLPHYRRSPLSPLQHPVPAIDAAALGAVQGAGAVAAAAAGHPCWRRHRPGDRGRPARRHAEVIEGAGHLPWL